MVAGTFRRLGEVVVLSVVGGVALRPHLFDDLYGLLEPLEAFLQGRIGNTQREVLTLEPGRADTQVGAAPG